MKFIFKRAPLLALLAISALLCACGEKTPEQIAAENKKKTELAVRRAQVFLFEEKNKQAIEILEKAYQEAGASAELCEQLAYAYAQDDNFPTAAIFFERASDLKNGDAELLLSAAKSYEQSGIPASAANAYEKYLKLKPADEIAWKAMAENLAKVQKHEEALNAYLGAVKAANRNPNTNEASAIGNLFLKVGNVPQARRWLEAAWGASLPENVEVRKDILLGLITVYLAEKETALLENSVAELDKIDANLVKEKYPELHKQLAEFRQRLKEAEDAIKAEQAKKEEELRKAEEEAKRLEERQKAEAEEKAAQEQADTQDGESGDAENTDTGESGVVQQTEIKDVETAKEDPFAGLSEYEKLLKQSDEALANGEYEAAEKFAHEAIMQNRNPAAAWRALAKAYETQGRHNDSYLAAREAYVRDTDDINGTLFYIRNASRVQNHEKFLNTLYRAHEKFPTNVEIYIGLARTYKILGDKRNARHFYNMFINNASKEHPLYQEVYDEFEEMLSNN